MKIKVQQICSCHHKKEIQNTVCFVIFFTAIRIKITVLYLFVADSGGFLLVIMKYT